MKIVHICVCGEFYEKYAYQDNLLPKYHRKQGHDVTIIAATYSRFDKDSGKVIQDYCKCKYLDDGTKLLRIHPLLPLFINSHIHLFYGLRKAVESENPDFLFVHGVECPNYLFISRYKKKNPSVRIVYDNHTDTINSLHTPITRWWARKVVGGIIVKRLLWTSEHFYGTTPKRSELLRDVYGVPVAKISLLPLGADDDEMQYDQKDALREGVRKKYSIKDNDFLIVTGGKIDKNKNIHTLVEAINKIDNPRIKILIFGSIVNEMKPVFNSLKNENTVFIGWVPSNDVYRYFYAADLVAFPGLHSALWEQAVASKVPTAFSEIDGFKHVDVCGNCLFFKNNTVDEYINILSNLLKSESKYNCLKKKAESEDLNLFWYSKIAKQVVDDAFENNE